MVAAPADTDGCAAGEAPVEEAPVDAGRVDTPAAEWVDGPLEDPPQPASSRVAVSPPRAHGSQPRPRALRTGSRAREPATGTSKLDIMPSGSPSHRVTRPDAYVTLSACPFVCKMASEPLTSPDPAPPRAHLAFLVFSSDFAETNNSACPGPTP